MGWLPALKNSAGINDYSIANYIDMLALNHPASYMDFAMRSSAFSPKICHFYGLISV
jgi:hypothetical protein